MTLEQFCLWEESHPHALGLVDWLLWSESGRLSLVNREETPTFYQTLAGVTHLEEQEVVELEKRFWDLAGNSGSGRIDVDIVAPLISPPLPSVLVSLKAVCMCAGVCNNCTIGKFSGGSLFLGVRREPGRPHRLQGALLRRLGSLPGSGDGEAEMYEVSTKTNRKCLFMML